MSYLTDRAEQMIADEQRKSKRKTRIYYLSFADEGGFRGAMWIRAVGPMSAIRRSHVLGINPGGEVLIAELPYDAGPNELPPADQYDKLHDLASLERMMPMTDAVVKV
jgi:hypothetical protein